MLNLQDRAFLSKLAYEPEINRIVDTLSGKFGIGTLDTEYVYIERTDTEGFLYKDEDTLVIAFSGTESIRDILQDIIFIPSKYMGGGYLHSGFNKIIKLMQDSVLESVENLFRGEPVKTIDAMGHSLGASISMGACDILSLNGYQSARTKITTFGCPNGFSRKARTEFNKRHPDTINYINPWDYVTYALSITTGRPGKDIKLSGRCGHFMDKYIDNIRSV